MNKLLKYLINSSCVALIFISTSTYGQTTESLQTNRAIHRSWGAQKIEFYLESNPEYLEKGLWYFSKSFEPRMADCASCEVDTLRLINYDLFNISDYETFRKVDERETINFKDYKIELLSKNELESYFGETVEAFLSGENHTAFPEWNFEDLSEDTVKKYMQRCKYYKINFKNEYRERISAENYHFIYLKEIQRFSQERIEFLQNNPQIFEVVFH